MTTRRAFLGAAGAALGAPLLARQLPSGEPNIVLLVLDTVRNDRFTRLAAAGSLPRLAALFASGTSYTNAWAHTSWSLPSHATILTGLHGHEHGADWPSLRLLPSAPTVASWLSANGYACGAFSGNSNWVTPEYLGPGFSRFQAYDLETHLRRTTIGRALNRAGEKLGSHAAGRGVHAATINERFFRFIDGQRDRSFFGYLTYMDVNRTFHHEKLGRPFWSAPATAQEVSAAYDRGLAALDADVGTLIDGLRERNRLDSTYVVIVSDHGESFGASLGDHDPDGHGTALYPEQTRVPLAVIGPFIDRREVANLVGVKQVPATIARLVGRPGAPFRDPLPPVNRPGDEGTLLATLRYSTHSQQALITNRMMYLKDLAANREELFDLVSDPGARRNLPADTATLETMRRRLAAALAG